MRNRYFVLSDNFELYQRFINLLKSKDLLDSFDFYCSKGNIQMIENGLAEIVIESSLDEILLKYKKGFSIHSKQMFPEKLVNSIQCINIHPGYNPYNRGWFHQVFSIINNEIIGATIHYMDEKLDNGKIIDRIQVEKKIWDTSETLYSRILDAEMTLLESNIENILNDATLPFDPEFRGKLYLKRDFDDLCRISLDQKGQFITF